MAQAGYKGKRVEVEILTDTYKIRGMLFVPLAGEGGYNSRLSDFLNNPDKHFLALTAVKVEALPECIVGMTSIVDNPHPIVIYSTRALKHKNVKRFRLEFSWT